MLIFEHSGKFSDALSAINGDAGRDGSLSDGFQKIVINPFWIGGFTPWRFHYWL